MAHYYINGDGSVTKKKKESSGNHYIVNNDGSISLLENKNQQEDMQQSRANYEQRQSQLRQARKEYDEKINKLESATSGLNVIRSSKLKQSGVKSVQELLEEEKNKKLPSYSSIKEGESISPSNNLNRKISENNSKYAEVNNDEEILKKREKVNEIANDLIYSKYKYNVADVDNYKMSTMEKLLGAIPRAINDLGSAFGTDNTYIDENGKKMHLPTRNALLQQKASEDSSLPVKMLTDTLYNGTKILATEGLNLVSGGMGGTALYFNDMFNDSYKNAYNKTGDTGKAFANGLAQTGLEFVTEKLLGGVSKSLTGGKASALENAISDKLYAKLGSKNLSKLAGSIGSEFTEEFVQEFAGNAIDLLTLGSESGYKDIKEAVFNEEVLKDALYSGMVGGLSGGFISGINMSTGLDRASQKVQLVEEFKTQLEESRKNVTDKNTIKALDTAIENVNKYLERPFTNLDNEEANNMLNNLIENPLNLNYNINNEEGIYDRRRNQTRIDDESNNVQSFKEFGQEKTRKYNQSEWENFESNAEIKRTTPTKEQIDFQNQIKSEFNKDIVYFDNSTSLYDAGASLKDLNKVYIPANYSPESQRFVTYHEILESEIAKNKQVKDKYINTAVYEILKDNNFENAKKEFLKDQSGIGNVPDRLIAKDIICDIYAEEKSGIEKGYDIPLSDNTKQVINYNLQRFLAETGKQNISRKNDTSNLQELDEGIIKKSSTGGRLQLPTIRNTQGRVQLPTLDNSISYDNNSTNNQNSQIASLPSQYNMQQKEANIPTYKDFANEKVEQKVNKQGLEAIRKAANAGKSYLQLKQSEVKTLRNDLKEYLGLSKEQLTNAKTYNGIKDKIEQFMNKQVEYLDEDLKRVKKEVRNAKIKVDSNIKEQITNYGDFRKQNFGKLRLTTEGQSIDSVYKELSELYPYYFDSSITSEADMLYELSDFMDKPNTITEEYKLSDSDIKKATDKIFNSLIDNSLSNEDIETMQNDILAKYSKRTRKIVQSELLNDMGITLDDISVGKDISSLDLQRTDPIRVNEKVFGAKIGQKINDETINKAKHNEAERTRFLNKERDEIKELGIKPRSKESAAVQKYGEKQYINSVGELVKYGDIELANEFSNVKTQEKIKHAAEVLRNKYDKYIEQINSVITELGYNPIPKRPDYMRHFQEVSDKLSQWGIPLNPTDLNKENIPTDINGLTDQFRPGKNWFASAMQRKGFKTAYDAITGIDGYLEGASNLIYHTEDIQRYRALSKFIRKTYGQTHGMENVDIDTKEGQQRLNDIFDNKLSKYVAWLDEQANSLAGKKGGIDRAAERLLGRKVYTILDTAKKQVGSNMTGFNVRSALTNFASAVQGASKTNKLAFVKGTLSTLKNIVHNDGMINKSDFLTNRFGSDQLSKKAWQKASNAGQIFMTGTDYFTANQIWRSKYYENLSKDMSESQAIRKADDFAARIMGDRSKGSTAEIFNSKTLGLLTQFQLEVNNQWSSIVHDNKMDVQRGNKSGATVVFQLGQLAAMSYFFNNFMKSLTGSDVMIDPIDMFKKLLGSDDDDDEEKTLEQRATEVFGDLINDLPFASFLTGGRIPIAEAFTGTETAFKKLTNQKDKFGNEIKWSDVGKDIISSGAYWLLPTGYGQIRKTTRGLSMYDKKLPVPGSYTESGNLRFDADESTGGKVKAVLFGQYSSKQAQDYINSGYKTIRKQNLPEMKDLGMNASEYRKYREALTSAGKKDIQKINYVDDSNYTEKQKNIMYKNILDLKEKELKVVNSMSLKDQNKYLTARSQANSINSSKDIESADKKQRISNLIIDSNLNDKDMAYLYSKYYSSEDKVNMILDMNIPIKEYIKADTKEVNGSYYAKTGKIVSGSKRKEYAKYVNTLNLSVAQKAILIKMKYNSFKTYDNKIVNYINNINTSANEKKVMLKNIGFKNFDKDVINYINSQHISKAEKEKKLKGLGFTIRNERAYYK